MNIIKETEVDYTTERTTRNWISLARKGLTYEDFAKLYEMAPYTLQDWAGILGLSNRSLQRYQKSGNRFSVAVSEKLLMIAHLFNRGTEVFGSKKHFFNWMSNPSAALNHNRPFELMDSMFGLQLLVDELGRIEHGIVA